MIADGLIIQNKKYNLESNTIFHLRKRESFILRTIAEGRMISSYLCEQPPISSV